VRQHDGKLRSKFWSCNGFREGVVGGVNEGKVAEINGMPITV